MGNRVTIAIPTRNRERYLALAISSALQQTYTNIQIIVSNNASSDNTTMVINSFIDSRITVLNQTSYLSMVENWNACVASAQGAYFLLLSDDDLLEPQAIARLVDVYENNNNPNSIGIVYCKGRFIDSLGKVTSIGQAAPSLETAEELILGFFKSKRDIWPCSILFRTSDLRHGYSAQFQLGMDAAMWMQSVIRYGSAAFIDDELVNYRVHLNTTASTPIGTWQKENLALATHAVELFKESGNLNFGLKKAIEYEVNKLNIRIIPGLIRSSTSTSIKLSLKLFAINLPQFLNPYGFFILCKGLFVLLAPQSLILFLRSCRKNKKCYG